MAEMREIPEETRRAVLKRAGGRCEDCHRPCSLELHHLRYHVYVYKYMESIYGRETPADLAALCRECHRRRHIDLNGEWWNDPEEMANYWASFYEAWDKDD
jgi:5-methylcytosine-specific restriction endonuclease McrA